MKVIVKVSGFYAGDWFEAGPKHIEMNEKVARQFLPPRGDQLADPATAKQKQKPLTPPAKDD